MKVHKISGPNGKCVTWMNWSAKYCHHKVPELVQVNPDKQEEKRITYLLHHPGSIANKIDQIQVFYGAKYCHPDKQFRYYQVLCSI